ncbi:hypothetical protein FACS189426_04180 [Bacteroidia bacterium]|nr:hypothetical protein FACS189426_04180 [Bacteroidia bacterium]
MSKFINNAYNKLKKYYFDKFASVGAIIALAILIIRALSEYWLKKLSNNSDIATIIIFVIIVVLLFVLKSKIKLLEDRRPLLYVSVFLLYIIVSLYIVWDNMDFIKNNFSILFEHIPLIITVLFFPILGFYINYQIHKQKIDEHFENTNSISDKIRLIFAEKSCNGNDETKNKKIDEIIKSPFKYALEILEGNSFPEFNPNYRGFNEIYENNVKLIVAVTAEPNLWLDPTQCFYMMNCCVVTLKRKQRPSQTMAMKSFENAKGFKSLMDIQKQSLTKLENWTTASLNEFDFFRFFIYKQDDETSLKHLIFPSLKASHDLFGIKSFFTKNETIKNYLGTTEYDQYCENINLIWEDIKNLNDSPAFRNIIDIRMSDHTPEFLVLFKVGRVIIHTFVEGTPYRRQYFDDDPLYSTIRALISTISRVVRNSAQYIPPQNHLNTKNSYIEWV